MFFLGLFSLFEKCVFFSVIKMLHDIILTHGTEEVRRRLGDDLSIIQQAASLLG